MREYQIVRRLFQVIAMFWEEKTQKIINGKIISYQKIAGRCTSVPSGTLLKDAVIESSGQNVNIDYLYVIDAYDMEKRSDFLLMKKGGKHLIIHDESKKKDILKSFRDYYRVSSAEAFFFLYLPLILIIAVMALLSVDSLLKTYMTVAIFSFVIRTCLCRPIGDFFLCLTVPSYIYLVLRF